MAGRWLVALLVGLAALMLLPGLLIGPSLDAAVFSQVARELREGATLYAQAWDHKPPGIYLLLAGLQLALPSLEPWPIAWGVSVLASAGTGTAVAVASRHMGVSPAGSVVASAAAVVAMTQYMMALGGGLTEPVATLPVAVALAVALAPGGVSVGRAVAVGTLLAAGLLISVQLLPGALAVAALVAARPPARGSPPMALLGLLGGGLLPIAAAVGWLALTDALGPAVEVLVDYSVAYRAIEAPSDRAFSAVASWTLLSLLFLIVPAILGAARLARPGSARPVGLACLAWVAMAVLLSVYQGRFYSHYAIPLAVPMALLAGPAIDRVMAAGARGRPISRAVRAAPFAVGLLVSLAAGSASGGMQAEPLIGINASSRAAAATIRETTDDADRIWVWGNAPQVYLDVGRPQATAFSYLYPLVTQGYATPDVIDRVLADLSADPPRVVVDAGSASPGAPGFHQLLIPRPLATDGRNLDILDPLRQFVAANYDAIGLVDGWAIYELRSENEPT